MLRDSKSFSLLIKFHSQPLWALMYFTYDSFHYAIHTSRIWQTVVQHRHNAIALPSKASILSTYIDSYSNGDLNYSHFSSRLTWKTLIGANNNQIHVADTSFCFHFERRLLWDADILNAWTYTPNHFEYCVVFTNWHQESLL